MRHRIDDETVDVGVGPLFLDVRLARELKWSEEEIADALTALVFLARGVEVTRSIRIGSACEHCGRAGPDERHASARCCGACKRRGR